MKVKLEQAVKVFFGKSSLEMVYFEAVANALDAEATEIDIDIQIAAINQPETLKISISDNGVGFTKDRYERFSNLFDVDENSHKGVGRLVYLCYFERIAFDSFFDGTRNKKFDLTASFDERMAKDTIVEERPSGTKLIMTGYVLTRLRNSSFVEAQYLKQRILEEFYSRLFQFRKEGKDFIISIDSRIGESRSTATLTQNDIPDLETIEVESPVDFFSKFYLHYSIKKVPLGRPSLIAAVSVDNRTIKMELIAPENIPADYNMVFLLFSDWFTGKTDLSRQNLDISEADLKIIQTIFRNKVATLIREKIPMITANNEKIEKNLVDHFPHLSGYFDSESIGFVSRAEVLQKAQDKFFKAQRELLDAGKSLTDEQYKKSFELSARALTEYVLFRQFTIEKLKNSSKKETEAELHNLFAKMRVQFDKNTLTDDLYRNNAWLLDDKYMTYETVLSDREMGDLIKNITEGEDAHSDGDRPDLALVFSNDPEKSKFFDVVMIEIKRRGITLEENMKTVTQLEKRARKLMKYYKDKIQRIWYYGIVEFNDDLEMHLRGEYVELFSCGKMYYRETTVVTQIKPEIKLPIAVFMWDIDAVAKDADARNSAFLNLIKSKFSSNAQ